MLEWVLPEAKHVQNNPDGKNVDLFGQVFTSIGFRGSKAVRPQLLVVDYWLTLLISYLSSEAEVNNLDVSRASLDHDVF